jgi:2-aminoethylphosphonate-pyruvate transaminase
MRAILLNPGPVSISEGVRRAAVATDLCHREAEFFDLQDRVRSKLTAVYPVDGDAWTAVLLGGSGTSAMEAMLASLLPRDARLLVIENGVYGERLARLAEIHGLAHEAARHDWQEAWDLGRVESALASKDFTHVAAVHHETTTGRLNPVAELALLCQRHGVSLLLDAVSSFGAEEIPFDSPVLLACAATANKCLHGIPGVAFVLVRRVALAAAVRPPRSLTLDLALWGQHQERRSTPFTPPVNGLLALEQALCELEQEGGWKARHARYHRLAECVARQLEAAGVEALLPANESSCVLRAWRLPTGYGYDRVHDGLRQRGFVIYGGQGELASSIFRIATMGDISHYDMDRLLVALEDVFSGRLA